ncbi:MAG: hypothetical protein WCF08_08320, partial [Anaerolineaceae bacterium]
MAAPLSGIHPFYPIAWQRTTGPARLWSKSQHADMIADCSPDDCLGLWPGFLIQKRFLCLLNVQIYAISPSSP